MKFLLWVALVVTLPLSAQTPADLSASIDWDEDAITAGAQVTYANIGVVEAAYNNAKRLEEAEFGLPVGAIADIDFPANWNDYCIDSMVLFILNHERSARGGLDYGDGPCAGLIFEGIEYHADTIAQSRADSCLLAGSISSSVVTAANVLFDDHEVLGGENCSNLIGPIVGCHHEHIRYWGRRKSYQYNGITSDSLITLFFIERVLYSRIYASGQAREALLLQDDDWADNGTLDPWGFLDNHGPAGAEGFIGVGVASGPYGPGGSVSDHADVFVLTYFDSAADALECDYLPLTTCCEPVLQIDDVPIAVGTYGAEILITSTGLVNQPSVHFQAGQEICLDPGFEVSSGAMFLADIEVCSHSAQPGLFRYLTLSS